jgi:adenosylcobinamide-GDP ribazoletransferase
MMTKIFKKLIEMNGPLMGMLVNLQFFTIIPIPYELPMNKKNITYAVKTFPILGLFQGGTFAGVLYLLIHHSPFSHLAIAFIIWLLTIVITGGLHLDGWMDASDAFFSYQSIEKRLEIMKDPRTGAFGVIALVVLLSGRFLFIYEITNRLNTITFISILTIPFLSKSLMGYLLLMVPAAREEGLGYFFQKSVHKNSLRIYPFYLLLFLVLVAFLDARAAWFIVFLMMVTIAFGLICRRKIIKWFGGITGDVLGASVEGMEWVLWMSIWLLHYYAMG